MNKEYTHITLVVDRSGSMSSCRKVAEEGINGFLRDQLKDTTERGWKTTVSLVQFDHRIETVYDFQPIQSGMSYSLKPDGSTALLDAIGKAINDTGSRLSQMPESDRPGVVVFVITTDGYENASREFTYEKIRTMISHQRDTYNWQFIFLSENEDMLMKARDSLDIEVKTSGLLRGANSAFAYQSTSDNIRSAKFACVQGMKADVAAYSDSQRMQMVEPDNSVNPPTS